MTDTEWKVAAKYMPEGGDLLSSGYIVAENNHAVALVVMGDMDNLPDGGAEITNYSDELMQQRANLIAAAPDLLAALKRLLAAPMCNEEEGEHEDIDAIQQADEAIRKAGVA